MARVVGGWGRDVKRAEVFLAFKGLGFLLLGVWFLLCFLRFRILRLGLGLVFGLGLGLVTGYEDISIEACVGGNGLSDRGRLLRTREVVLDNVAADALNVLVPLPGQISCLHGPTGLLQWDEDRSRREGWPGRWCQGGMCASARDWSDVQVTDCSMGFMRSR